MDADKVVAVLRTSATRDDALALGADEFMATSDDKSWIDTNARSLDVILLTAPSSSMPIDSCLSMCRV